jgi:hypothetical protein
MTSPIPRDLKQRAEKLCREYGYLTLYDPGTWFTNGSMTFVLVHDQENRSLWISLPVDSESHSN